MVNMKLGESEVAISETKFAVNKDIRLTFGGFSFGEKYKNNK